MELLDMTFAPCYSQSLLLAEFKKTILSSGFKNLYKKICEKRILGSIHEKHVLERNNESTKNALQEFHFK
jgi:hypothetical protein